MAAQASANFFAGRHKKQTLVIVFVAVFGGSTITFHDHDTR
jgi:hypothetical protein